MDLAPSSWCPRERTLWILPLQTPIKFRGAAGAGAEERSIPTRSHCFVVSPPSPVLGDTAAYRERREGPTYLLRSWEAWTRSTEHRGASGPPRLSLVPPRHREVAAALGAKQKIRLQNPPWRPSAPPPRWRRRLRAGPPPSPRVCRRLGGCHSAARRRPWASGVPCSG